jgi:long-subunit fatty acid transport protein
MKTRVKTRVLTLAAFAASAVAAQAGGLDRSDQPIGVIFETGNHIDLSFGFSLPSAEGTDLATTAAIDNVADDFMIWSGAIKYEVTDNLSFALIVDEPYGSDVTYPGNPAFTSLGGTSAIVDSFAVTAVARYKFDDNWSVHGGLRYQEISANIGLGGGAYGPLSGYNAAFASGGEVGYLVGFAYEVPTIALRVALTYNSEITHDLDTVETGVPFFGTVTDVTTITAPESLNLSFQTGVAKDTLVFGSVRYARYSDTIVSPTGFDAVVGPGTPGDSLSDLEDTTDFEIGIGRRFNDKWSGSLAVGFESEGADSLVSPLAPTNGATYLVVGAKYDVNESFSISGGIRYTDLGDAFAETGTPDVARGDFNGNNAVSVGIRFGYKF